jgi:hypothetical protein
MKFTTCRSVVAIIVTAIICLTRRCVNATVAYNLGYIEIDMRSTQPPQTNKLLHAVLSVTTNVVSIAFDNNSDEHYDRISCSINSYNFEGSADNDDSKSATSPFSALVTITGKALFNESTSWTQTNVTDFVTSIFATDGDRSFLKELEMENDNIPFLSNLTYVAVRVDGDVVAEDTSDTSNGDKASNINTKKKDPALDVWMIALIGGLGAFILVLCAVITCICCIPLDDDANGKVNMQKNQLGQHGTNPTRSESKMEENIRMDDLDKSPSEAKSIGSQDSSLFTYNPKSVRSFDSKKSYNSYFTYGTQGIEMDVATWQAKAASNIVPDDYATSTGTSISANQISFGQDISAIEAKKGDLSLIQEDEENESTIAGSVSVASSDVISPLPTFHPHSPTHENASNTVASSSPSRASGKYKSLLASLTHSKSNSTNGISKASLAQQYLTSAAKKDMQNDNDEESNMVEIYSRDSQSTGSGSQSSRNSRKAHAAAQQPLSQALAAGPPSTAAQTLSNPVTLYQSNNPSATQGAAVNQKFHGDTIAGQPSDEETDDTESSYGPSYFVPQPRINLGGSANDVLNDLNDLSAQIDEIRNSHSSGNSSISGRAAIRLRR